MQNLAQAFIKLKEIVGRLRDPNGGCPWDLERTHKSLIPCLIEEAYEVIDAIERKPDKLCEELGDVLLQVVLHAQIAAEGRVFSLEEVIKVISEKLIVRHPHVFGEEKLKTAKDVVDNWEMLKRKERGTAEGTLNHIPHHLPALLKAQKMGDKAARVGFDWVGAGDVKRKIEEELLEFLSIESDARMLGEELGDILFSLAQYARKLGLNAEEELRSACHKFERRFGMMEKNAAGDLKGKTLDQLEALWQAAKEAGNR